VGTHAQAAQSPEYPTFTGHFDRSAPPPTAELGKRLAVQGRPTQIVEHREVGEIIRQLVAMGVVVDDAIDGTAEEDDDGPLAA
jgi:hypothetical protein